MHTVDKRLN